MSQIKLAIIGKYFSVIWTLSMVLFIDAIYVQVGSEQNSPASIQNFFDDLKAEPEVYSENGLRLKITWNHKMTNDSKFDVNVEPIDEDECHNERCILNDQFTQNATLFIPREPQINDGSQTDMCIIKPGCSYKITISTVPDNFKTTFKYTVPDPVGSLYSCRHAKNLPNVTTHVESDSELMTINWKISENFQVPRAIKVYIIVSISETNAGVIGKELKVFNHLLTNSKPQAGQLKWVVESGKEYLIRTSVFDNNRCSSENSPNAVHIRAPVTVQNKYYKIEPVAVETKLFPFEDFKAEAEIYSEHTLRLKVTWNPNTMNDTMFNVFVQPLDDDECHHEPCNLYGRTTLNATLFIPSEPSTYDHSQTCIITPACNYQITVSTVSHKFEGKLKYTVPDPVGNIYSCRHARNLPIVKKSVHFNNQLMTINWKIDEKFQIPSDINVYLRVSIFETNEGIENELKVFNYSLTNSTQQTGQFKCNVENGKFYIMRTTVFDNRHCSSINSPEVDFIQAPASVKSKYSVRVVWLIIGVASSLIILIGSLIYFKKEKQKKRETNINLCNGIIMEENIRYRDNIPTVEEIPHNNLRIIKEIGMGAFGRVYLATARNICGKQGFQFVAIKQLKRQPTEEEKEDFLAEIQTMVTVSYHDNIVALLGCSTVQEPLQMVMEYVGCGDLLKYLRKVRAKHEEYASNRNMRACQLFNNGTVRMPAEQDQPLLSVPIGNYLDVMNSSSNGSTSDSSYVTDTEAINLRPSLTETQYTTLTQVNQHRASTVSSLEYVLDHKELHNFATQIARGMTHLHAKNIIHRDLAARNILIDENKTLKISDFGLSRSGVYVNRRNKKVPLRWLSIEAMRNNYYTDKSDVWAFGIVLWEIGTLGGYPYPTLYNHELLKFLLSGMRLEQPENCSKYLYELMLKCWAGSPDDRPDFSQILMKLDPGHQKIYIDFSELSSDYVFPPTKKQLQNNGLKVAQQK